MKLGGFVMEEIKPAFLENNVPICFSANDTYVPLLSVTIKSIIDSSSPEKNYDIVILMTSINDENQLNLRKLIASHQNFSIRFVNVGPYVYGYNFYTDADPTNTKFTDEIYYRVLVPSLMKSYEKVLFFDADLLILDDVSKLYDSDISGYLVGAVRDYEGIANCYHKNYEITKYRINELGITRFDDYFNSGVLLMNIEMFNKAFSTTALLELSVSKNWRQFEQDVFNFLCKESVCILDASWNFLEDYEGTYHKLPERLFNEFLKSEKSPKIVHFAGRRKPWIYLGSKHNKVFWKTAEQTPFESELKKYLEE